MKKFSKLAAAASLALCLAGVAGGPAFASVKATSASEPGAIVAAEDDATNGMPQCVVWNGRVLCMR